MKKMLIKDCRIKMDSELNKIIYSDGGIKFNIPSNKKINKTSNKTKSKLPPNLSLESPLPNKKHISRKIKTNIPSKRKSMLANKLTKQKTISEKIKEHEDLESTKKTKTRKIKVGKGNYSKDTNKNTNKNTNINRDKSINDNRKIEINTEEKSKFGNDVNNNVTQDRNAILTNKYY